MADWVHIIHKEVIDISKTLIINTPNLLTLKGGNRHEEFAEGDLVLVYLKKERFQEELQKRKIGLCQILKKIGSNAYVVELPEGYNISNIFSISDLSTYFPLDELHV